MHLKDDYDFLKRLFDDGKNIIQIANICKCSKNAIKRSLVKFNIIEDDIVDKNSDIQPHKICCICNKSNLDTKIYLYNKEYYCRKHYLQLMRHGKIFTRTIYDPNEIIIQDDFAEVVLYNSKGEVRGKAIIDLDDVNKCKEYKWYFKKDGYIITTIDNKKVYMQSILLNTNDKIDHINKNKTDNRKSNLRIVDSQQNAMNMSKKCNNTSGVTGVMWDKIHQVWNANITYKYKVYARSFHNFDEAVKYRLGLEKQYFGRYSPNYNKDENMIELTYLSQEDNKIKTITLNL